MHEHSKLAAMIARLISVLQVVQYSCLPQSNTNQNDYSLFTHKLTVNLNVYTNLFILVSQ